MTEFGRAYGITFRDPVLLKLALTHRSYLHVTGQGPRESNERLEFLGDSVLGLVTSEFLYRSHPSEHEGQLTKTKSLLVSKAILSRRALAMGLGRFVLMSHAEVESGGRQRLSILADAFESVIGAVYLDQGFEAARAFIDRWLLRESKVIAADRRHTNYKSHLQEYVQSTFRTHPVYRIRSEMGPDHSKQFMVEVMVGRRVLGEGRGRNKKEAEQAAARNALEAVESGPVSDRDKRREERVTSREGGARESVVPQSGRAAPPARPIEADEEESSEAAGNGEEHGRRRRRGRRGGRGRGARDANAVPGTGTGTGTAPPPPAGAAPRMPAAPVRSESAPPAERAVTPVRSERTGRLTPPPPLPVLPTPVEIEPMPPASDEDENEEVGRPEGPHEERHIDPYAWGSRSRPAAVESEPPPAVRRESEPPRVAVTESEPERPAARERMREAMRDRGRPARMEPETIETVEPDRPEPPEPDEEPWVPATPAEPEVEPSAEEPEEAEPGPRYPEVEAPPPPPPPAAPSWGRRNRRGR
jgi:ribonuclease-3